MTDLREAYNLESFGDGAGCKSDECNCNGAQDDCASESCKYVWDGDCAKISGVECVADGSCGDQVSQETLCCPKVESFGNVRRPRRVVRYRRRPEGFGNVRRPRRVVRYRRRERFTQPHTDCEQCNCALEPGCVGNSGNCCCPPCDEKCTSG